MICKEILERFIHLLTVNENTFSICQSAFAEIGAAYHIGKLTSSFHVENTIYTVGGNHTELVLFNQETAVKETPAHTREFITGEKGTVKFFLYQTMGQPALTQEELCDLDIIINVLFNCCGRWRLIQQIKKVSLSDSLTGLVNAGGFLSYVDELLDKKELIQYNAYYFNLERFSLVNKRFGAQETDTIIVRYVAAMREFLTDGECLGRLGGDNFVALIKKERTEQFIQLLQDVPVYGMSGKQKITVHIGAKAGGMIIDESVTDCGSIIHDCATALNIARLSPKSA